MRSRKGITATLVLLFAGMLATAQQPLPPGDKIPDWKFSPILNSGELDLGQYRGRIILITFWYSRCGASFDILPLLAAWQEDFRQDLKVILVAEDEDPEHVRKAFQNRKKLADLGLPVMKKDPAFSGLFPHTTVPHIVIISRDGRLIAATAGDNLSAENLVAIIRNQPVSFPGQQENEDKEYNLDTAGTAWMGATLMPAPNHTPGGMSITARPREQTEMAVTGSSIEDLFATAYEPLLQLTGADYPTRIRWEGLDREDGGRRYNYRLRLPGNHQDNRERLLAYMRQDLDRFFNTTARVERKKARVWVLRPGTAGSSNRLAFYTQQWITEVEFHNTPLTSLAEWIKTGLDNQPLIIEGDKKRRFILTLPKKFTADRLKKELALCGISLEEEERELDFLVITKKK